ncbi:MAG: hypothetical protein V3R93_01335 [Candidatus Hydrothermarchaeaceae archaeon]
MAGICACVPPVQRTELKSEGRSYTICRSSDLKDTLENYTLIPVERAGFVVIKQVISLDDGIKGKRRLEI